jgi:catechol 2,3-dioxygenase-like lactoylglutathione lyase family enzyme
VRSSATWIRALSQPEMRPLTMTDSINFHHASPILRVNNLEASIRYFCETLGFSLDWQDPTQFASVTRGDASLMLSVGEQGSPPAWVWIGVGDPQALHDEYAIKGARIRMEPTNFPWALEMHVEDLDGNVLRLGSDPLPDTSFGPGWN